MFPFIIQMWKMYSILLCFSFNIKNARTWCTRKDAYIKWSNSILFFSKTSIYESLMLLLWQQQHRAGIEARVQKIDRKTNRRATTRNKLNFIPKQLLRSIYYIYMSLKLTHTEHLHCASTDFVDFIHFSQLNPLI